MDKIVSTLEDASQEVFDTLGAGHSESTYHSALMRELSSRGVSFTSEGTIPILYKGSPVGRFRPDLFIETDDGTVVIELKATNSTGEDQLDGYLSILDTDNNFDVMGGILIRFNDDVEVIEA